MSGVTFDSLLEARPRQRVPRKRGKPYELPGWAHWTRIVAGGVALGGALYMVLTPPSADIKIEVPTAPAKKAPIVVQTKQPQPLPTQPAPTVAPVSNPPRG